MHKDLYHHGIKGMKWGVRRTPAQLGHKVDKLKKKNQKLASKLDPNKVAKAQSYQAKASALKSKATKNTIKAGKYADRTDRYQKYSDRKGKKGDTEKSEQYSNLAANNSKKSSKYTKKASKYAKKQKFFETKADAILQEQDSIKKKIERNKNIQKMYESTIKDLDKGKVKQGRLFMQYSYDR